MGLIAHIMMYDIICDAVIELLQKITEKKWTNECTNCEVPGRDGQNSFKSMILGYLP